MNAIGGSIYLYISIFLIILGLVPIYIVFFKLPKLEVKKIKEELISQYRDNLKNIMPSLFNRLLIIFLTIGVIIGIALYYITGYVITLVAPIICMFFVLYIAGLHKYPVYIYKDGFYFNGIYPWKCFKGYKKLKNRIKLIGKEGITVDMYLKDTDGKIEKILRDQFKNSY